MLLDLFPSKLVFPPQLSHHGQLQAFRGHSLTLHHVRFIIAGLVWRRGGMYGAEEVRMAQRR